MQWTFTTTIGSINNYCGRLKLFWCVDKYVVPKKRLNLYWTSLNEVWREKWGDFLLDYVFSFLASQLVDFPVDCSLFYWLVWWNWSRELNCPFKNKRSIKGISSERKNSTTIGKILQLTQVQIFKNLSLNKCTKQERKVKFWVLNNQFWKPLTCHLN